MQKYFFRSFILTIFIVLFAFFIANNRANAQTTIPGYIVGVMGGNIYTSFNSGSSWRISSLGTQSWIDVTSSYNGNYLAAASLGGYIFTSSDGGDSWTAQTSTGLQNWLHINFSGDGRYLIATPFNSSSNTYIYLSYNFGEDLTPITSAGARKWHQAVISDSGQKLAAVDMGGYIYTSSNSGASWTARTSAGSRNWFSITSSSDGTYLAAAANGGYIYTSSDSGVTWTARTSSGSRDWNWVKSSSNGQYLVATAYNSSAIYISSDRGVTWSTKTSTGVMGWFGETISNDGLNVASVAYKSDGGFYPFYSTNNGASWSQLGTGIISTTTVVSVSSFTLPYTPPPANPYVGVSLTANPSRGAVPFNSTLTANRVSGNVTGSISYRFKCKSSDAWSSSQASNVYFCNYTFGPTIYYAYTEISQGGVTGTAWAQIVTDPYNLTISKTCNSPVKLTWEAVPGATSYTITRSTGVQAPTVYNVGAVTTFYDTEASLNTLWIYKIKANNLYESNQKGFDTSTDLCDPGDLSVYAGCNNPKQNSLSWVAIIGDMDGFLGYNVYRDGVKINTTLVPHDPYLGYIFYYDTTSNVTSIDHVYFVRSVYQTTGEVGISNNATSTSCYTPLSLTCTHLLSIPLPALTGGSVKFTANPVGGSGNFTYTWVKDPRALSLVISPDGKTATSTYPPGNNMYYDTLLSIKDNETGLNFPTVPPPVNCYGVTVGSGVPVGGYCSAVPTEVSINKPVVWTVYPSGGNFSTYAILWGSDTDPALFAGKITRNAIVQYPSITTVGNERTAKVRITSADETIWKDCDNEVTVTQPTLKLWIGTTESSANLPSLSVRKGKPFWLKWRNEVENATTSCSSSVKNNKDEYFTDWGSTSFFGVPTTMNPEGSKLNQTLSQAVNIPVGQYTFTTTCPGKGSGGTDLTSSVILRVTGIGQGEL